MKDFKSYSETPPENNPQQENKSGSDPAYNNTIIAEAERGKREGTLSNADLDNFYNALSPFLDGFKKRKLKEVITRLKGI